MLNYKNKTVICALAGHRFYDNMEALEDSSCVICGERIFAAALLAGSAWDLTEVVHADR